MTRWYQALGASLLAPVLTRSMATAGWNDHIGSDKDHIGSDERPTVFDAADVLNRLCGIEEEWEARPARTEADEVGHLQRDATVPRSASLFGPGWFSPAGRCFDVDWTIDGEPAWLSYLANSHDREIDDREENPTRSER